MRFQGKIKEKINGSLRYIDLMTEVITFVNVAEFFGYIPKHLIISTKM